MLYLSTTFSDIKEAQNELARSAFFLFDIHQVLFHRRGITPLIKGLLHVKKKPRTFKEGMVALSSPQTWKALHECYREGNRVTEAYLNATQQHPHLHSELLDYSNNIYTADSQMQMLLLALKKRGHERYLLSNIGSATFVRLKEQYQEYFSLLTYPENTINCDPSARSAFLWKPQKAAYEHALTAIGKANTPHHAIFIDDTKRNIRAAHESGLNAIHFSSSAQCKKDIEALLGAPLL